MAIYKHFGVEADTDEKLYSHYGFIIKDEPIITKYLNNLVDDYILKKADEYAEKMRNDEDGTYEDNMVDNIIDTITSEFDDEIEVEIDDVVIEDKEQEIADEIVDALS